MKHNIAPWDRWLRLGVGCLMFVLAWYLKAWWPLVLGIILVWTAAAGWCLLYQLLGIGKSRNIGTSAPDSLVQGFASVARRAVEQVTAGKAALLDVRRDDEWAASHVPMALHWELAKLEAGQLPDIPKERTIFVHCAAGGRAGKAVGILKAAGYSHAENCGGLSDWQSAGGEVTK